MEELRGGSVGSGSGSARRRASSPSALLATAATDATLLLASLEQAPVEDEAEAALIRVLERRQVTFDADLPVPTMSTPHRRMRTASSELTGFDNMMNAPTGPSPYGKLSPSVPRPPLARRVVSHGHRRLRSRGGGGRLRDSGLGPSTLLPGDLDQIFTGDSRDDSNTDMDIPPAKSGESQGGTSVSSSSNKARPGAQRAKSARFLSHRRVMSALPAGLDRNASDLSQQGTMAGLTDAGERSLRIARALQTFNDGSEGNLGDSTTFANPMTAAASGLPDLLNIMEAKREQENESANQGGGNSRGSLQGGSAQGGSKTGGSRGGGSRSAGSRNGGSLFSGGGGKSSTGARSRGDSSSVRRGRPFFGVSSPWSNDGGMSNVDTLLQAAERVQELCQIPETAEDEEDAFAMVKEDVSEQNAAFLSQLAASHPVIEQIDLEGLDGATDEKTPMLQQARMRRRAQLESVSSNWCYNQPAFRKVVSWVGNFRKQMQLLAVAFDLPFVAERLWAFIQHEVTMYLVPAVAVSAFLFYHLNNPAISWLILFAMRNYMTLQLAYGSEYVLVDVLALRSTLLLEIVGPLVTLYIIQAKGWPLICIFWATWSLALILNMDGWLSWTEIEMFTTENQYRGIVFSDTYLEVLASLILVGVAVTIKRTVLAMFLGKRIYFHYKKKVERVMLDMLLMTEVADLSQAIDEFEFVEEEENPAIKHSTKGSIAQTFKNTTMADIAKNRLRASSGVIDESDSDEDDKSSEDVNLSLSVDEDEEPPKLPPSNPSWSTLRRDTSARSDTSDASAPESPVRSARSIQVLSATEVPDGPPPVQNINEPVRNLLRNTSTTSQIKSLLYRWEEPVNKKDREIEEPTIHEILQFRKALSFLEDTHPFGLSFGPAVSRDSCIKSAKALYRRLLALTPGSPVLHFDVIGVLAYNADDSFDEKKAKELVKLFRPDKNDEISLLAFVQSCDSAYKKLRYLRAGVGNSTLIDNVLENFFNGVFSLCLALAVMTILQMNPWTLLVSMSTVIVSFAFAFGPSVANIVEGCIMIAVRRPFDLGDRISIADASASPQDCDPGFKATWFVEDCNLFTTTLRLSKSNEVATVKNGTIADKKIINHNRSEKAVVNIDLSFKSTVTQEEAMIVKSAIEHYISDNPRVWAQLINFRIVEVDPCNDVAKYAITVQHQRSWQDLLPVLTSKGELIKFCTEVLIQLNVHYENKPAIINDVYIKELPEDYATRMLSQPVLG